MQRTIRIFTMISLSFLSGALLGQPSPSVNGDVDGDGKLDISDAIYILNHLFGDGPPPVPSVATEKPTVIYLVRHTEANKDDPHRTFSRKTITFDAGLVRNASQRKEL